jgi:hypothetical protein
MGYEATANEDVVIQTNDREVDLSALVDEYLTLKTEYQDRPQVKTVPDQETLNYYNAFIVLENVDLETRITVLFYRLKPIYEAGLLPSKYNDEYQQLENFVTG